MLRCRKCMWACQLWQPLRMWQEVQWQEARNDFKNKYAQFEQSEEREEENVGQKCVWVLWYDESVIAGLDLSQSCCFKETLFTLLLWSVVAVWNQRWCRGPCEVIRLVGVCYEMKACGLFAGCESKKQQRGRLRGTEGTRETQMSAAQISCVVMVAVSQPLDLSARAFSSSFSPSERLKSSSVGERWEFRRNPKLLSRTQSNDITKRSLIGWAQKAVRRRIIEAETESVLRYKGWIRVWLELQCTIALSLAWFIHIHTTPPQCVHWQGKHIEFIWIGQALLWFEQLNLEFIWFLLYSC